MATWLLGVATGVLVIVLAGVVVGLAKRGVVWSAHRQTLTPEVRWLLVRVASGHEGQLNRFTTMDGQSFDAGDMILDDTKTARSADEAGMRARVDRLLSAIAALQGAGYLDHSVIAPTYERWRVSQSGRVASKKFEAGVDLADNPFA